MTKITKDEFDNKLQNLVNDLRSINNNVLVDEFKDHFIDAYLNLLSNIEGDEYRRQRAITALNWIMAHYKKEYASYHDTQKQFIAAFNDRLNYDFDHPEPLKPSFLASFLERLAEIMHRNQTIIDNTCKWMFLISLTAGWSFFITGAAAGIAPLFLIGFALGYVVPMVMMGIYAVAESTLGRLRDSKFNILDMFFPADESSKEKKAHVAISCDNDHVINAKQDIHLRPWLKQGLFSSQQTTTNDTTKLLEPINTLSN